MYHYVEGGGGTSAGGCGGGGGDGVFAFLADADVVGAPVVQVELV